MTLHLIQLNIITIIILITICVYCSDECGKRYGKYQYEVINGKPGEIGDWPWHAAIYHVYGPDELSRFYSCGGILINSMTILTAAQCLFSYVGEILKPNDFLVLLGKYSLNETGQFEKKFNVSKVIVHPYYVHQEMPNNLGILKSSNPITFDKFIYPICLWPTYERTIDELIGINGAVIGWGLPEFGTKEPSVQLNQMNIPIIPTIRCLNIYQYYIDIFTEANYCAGLDNANSVLCIESIGNGMAFQSKGIYYLRGILLGYPHNPYDHPHRCSNEYGFFIDIAQYLEWIKFQSYSNENIADDVSAEDGDDVDDVDKNNSISINDKKQNMSESKIKCGERRIQHQGLITHGFKTKAGDWPWHAAIYHIIQRKNEYKCGGTLINKRTILTAAHCLIEDDQTIIAERIIVVLGKFNLLISGHNSQEFKVFEVLLHESFDFEYFSNDIALLILNNEAKLNNYVQPICLWPPNKTDIDEVIGKPGTVVGWGYNEAEHTSEILNQAKMPIVASSTCIQSKRNFFEHFLTEKNFCAGYRNGTSVCVGDSGGGLFFEINGLQTIRGILSLGAASNNSTCNIHEYVVFTDVAKYLDWIDKKSIR